MGLELQGGNGRDGVSRRLSSELWRMPGPAGRVLFMRQGRLAQTSAWKNPLGHSKSSTSHRSPRHIVDHPFSIQHNTRQSISSSLLRAITALKRTIRSVGRIAKEQEFGRKPVLRFAAPGLLKLLLEHRFQADPGGGEDGFRVGCELTVGVQIEVFLVSLQAAGGQDQLAGFGSTVACVVKACALK